MDLGLGVELGLGLELGIHVELKVGVELGELGVRGGVRGRGKLAVSLGVEVE